MVVGRHLANWRSCVLCFIIYMVGFLLLSISTTAQGKYIEGELRTHENWAFLTRFCFLSRYGKFSYEVEYPKEYQVQNMLLYYDTKSQWPAVYKSAMKECEEKESVLNYNNGQIINLTQYYRPSGCTVKEDENVLKCQHYRHFESARERWWFIAISNCKSEKGLRIKYKILMTNDEYNLWFKHFSADEFYILQVDIVFAGLYLILFLASCIEAHTLHSRHLLHVTYKMYMASLICECVGLLLLCSAYAIYAQDGIGSPSLKLLGKTMESICTLIFLLLLILLAKGYTVTRGRLRPLTSAKIGIFMTLYTVVYAALFIYEEQFFDPGEVLYLYESPAGYGIIALRLVGWGWFVYATIFTLIHYPEKSAFFSRLFLIYSSWFISAPVVILISTLIVPKHMRETIINGVELSISILAHFVFFVLTRPSAANKNFPFHVRTTQIDIMQHSASGTAGENTIDAFNRYPYAPQVPSAPLPIPAEYVPDYAGLFGAQNGGVNNTIEMNNAPPRNAWENLSKVKSALSGFAMIPRIFEELLREDEEESRLSVNQELNQETHESLFTHARSSHNNRTSAAPSVPPNSARNGTAHINKGFLKKDEDQDGLENLVVERPGRRALNFEVTEVVRKKNKCIQTDVVVEAARNPSSVEIQYLSDEIIRLKRSILSLQNVQGDPELFFHYTGLPDYDTFLGFFSQLEKKDKRIAKWRLRSIQEAQTYQLKMAENKLPALNRPISLEDELFMVLVTLRTGMPRKEASRNFGVPEEKITEVFLTWISFLYVHVRTFFALASRGMSEDEASSFIGSLRIIMDCTDVRLQRPIALGVQEEFLPSYYNYNTFRVLVCVTEDGTICYVSRLFGRGCPDLQIVEESGVLSMLKDGDTILADEEFAVDIRELLPVGVKLNVSPKFRTASAKKGSLHDDTKLPGYVARVHMEHAIRRIKSFHILDGALPRTMASAAEHIFTVCAYLANFQSALNDDPD